ncbi:MAG: hypothetical protein WCA13_21340 [Terriglobales bacterium]
MSKAPLVITTVIGLPILIAAAVFGPTAFDLVFHRRPPERFLIPAGYSGWVRVDFRQKGAPPLPTEDGRLLLKLDEHGRLQTSSDPQSGHGRDDFFYYAGDRRTPLSNAGVCKGGMVWQIETIVDESTSTPFARFFVGTEQQYRHEVDPSGKDFPVCER